ncbi:MAG: hypothetical protein D6800_12140, partial [Candidatus Zixiibacteriota bacterium]
MKKLALGKGLDALIPTDAPVETVPTQFPEVPVDAIAPNPMQPRKEFDGEQLQQLALSVREHGLLQPLV